MRRITLCHLWLMKLMVLSLSLSKQLKLRHSAYLRHSRETAHVSVIAIVK